MVVISGARRTTNGTFELELGEHLIDRTMGIVGEAREHMRHAQIVFERDRRREVEQR